ncbi:MAG: hypothetical protein Q9209_004496 [Squamulea sp. 1 TL-2023]
MWINFKASRRFAIKIFVGGINAISGEPMKEDSATMLHRLTKLAKNESIQDYVVAPKQLWLDGIASNQGYVRQFVATPLWSGYSVEAQITGQDVSGGIQFVVVPSKTPPKLFKLSRQPGTISIVIKMLTGKSIQIKNGTVIYLILRLRGGGGPPIKDSELGIAPGGLIKQCFLEDYYPESTWDIERTLSFNVQILNTQLFEQVTGVSPPRTPISAKMCLAHGLPFFEIYNKTSAVVGDFKAITSVAGMAMEKATDTENGEEDDEEDNEEDDEEYDEEGDEDSEMDMGNPADQTANQQAEPTLEYPSSYLTQMVRTIASSLSV